MPLVLFINTCLIILIFSVYIFFLSMELEVAENLAVTQASQMQKDNTL